MSNDSFEPFSRIKVRSEENIENWTLKLRYCILYKLISIIKKKIDSEYVDTLKNSKNSSDKINNNFDNLLFEHVMLIIHAPQTTKWEIASLRYFFFFPKNKISNFQIPNLLLQSILHWKLYVN